MPSFWGSLRQAQGRLFTSFRMTEIRVKAKKGILVCKEGIERHGMLKVGDEAPDFDLEAVTSNRLHRVKLSDFRDRQNVVIAFHPLDWTPT